MPETEAQGHPVTTSAHVFDVRGRLVEIRKEGREVVVAHEAIPGYMDAMTMPFHVKETTELEGLKPGDAISFRYHVSRASSWISAIRRMNEEEAASLVLAEMPVYEEPSDASMYVAGGTWTDHNGRKVSLSTFQGHPVVLSMIFTHCSYACPVIVTDMKRIGAQLPAALRDRVRYVLVSLDPDRDTPEVLRRFAERHELDLSQWTLLRGEEEQVRMLAALLGVRYRRQADGQFGHTSLISILNERGEIVHQQKGLNNDGRAAARALEDLPATSRS